MGGLDLRTLMRITVHMARKSPKPLTARPAAKAAKRATNLTLPIDLLAEARECGINLSRACAHGLALAIAEERSRRWAQENKAAIESSNRYVERRGLPLARYRRF
jgi:antitoxin CcdA